MEQKLVKSAKRLFTMCRKKELKLATAESCTGGMISAALTEVPGSSSVFLCGFVVYSNRAKMDMLGVRRETLKSVGAVSGEVAREMALGALERGRADVAIAVTGIAGPGEGMGLVHMAAVAKGQSVHQRCQFKENTRAGVRLATAIQAMALAEEIIAGV